MVLPPAAMGPVVAMIGLELSGSAASNAGLLCDKPDMKNVIVFLVTLGVAIFGNILFRGFLSVIPILIAVIAGYVAAFCLGFLDFSQVAAASWFALPNFQPAKFDMGAILMILPVLLVITSEHIGHQVVTSEIIGRDLLKDPGLHRSLFADNFSTMISGLIGSVPTTTYGENIGVMAMTKVYSVYVIGGAAVLSIICSFIGYNGTGVWAEILKGLNSGYWCKPSQPIYSLGLLLYIVLIVFFAYFYTSITFNPLMIADNMKKQGGFIPGIRPGKPTSDYLNKILNYIVFIGAIGLIIVSVIPYFFNGVFGASVSFGGTSLIIIVSVVLETMKQVESQMLVRNYKGFLED